MFHKLTVCLFLYVFLITISLFSVKANAQESGGLTTAVVVPPVGTVTGPELKTCAVEIREQLRTHGYRLAVQQDVRAAMTAHGIRGKPTAVQLKETASSLGADIIFVSIVAETQSHEIYLDMAAMNAKTGGARAIRAKLPSRGAAPYEAEHFLPAVAACVAALVDKNPNPMYGPFPSTAMSDVGRLIRKETPKPPVSAVTLPIVQKKIKITISKAESPKGPVPAESEAAAPVEDEDHPTPKLPESDSDKKKKPYDWKKWDHAGLFGEIGFMFSWCRRDGMCDATSKGYGARIRLGVRIASFVALSFSAAAVDHQMPITTDTEVFLNVKQAFVYAAVFGGLRVHPVRRFPVDPYVGIDFGYSWLLYAQNTDVEVDPSIPEPVSDQLGSLVAKRRQTLYLKGFTVTPELGVNFFVAPALAFGVHVQWILPFWKNVCSRVYNPTIEGLKNVPQVCTLVKNVGTAENMDQETIDLLSKKDNLPRFISLELDLTFVFK